LSSDIVNAVLVNSFKNHPNNHWKELYVYTGAVAKTSILLKWRSAKSHRAY